MVHSLLVLFFLFQSGILMAQTDLKALQVEYVSLGAGIDSAAKKKISAVIKDETKKGNVISHDEKHLGLEGETVSCTEFRSSKVLYDAVAKIAKLKLNPVLVRINQQEDCSGFPKK